MDDTDRQQQQRDMMEAGHSLPGVTEALQLYESLTQGKLGVAAQTPTVRYATSGNP